MFLTPEDAVQPYDDELPYCASKAGLLARIDALDTGVRGGPEPALITPEAFDREIPEA